MAIGSDITEHSYEPGAAMAAEALTGLVFFDPDELVVEHWAAGATAATAVLARDVDYTIGGDGSTASGTIAALAAWPDGDRFYVRRESPALQPESLPKYQDLSAKDIERGLDRGVLHDQDQDREIARTLRVPRGESGLTLPPLADRIAMFLGFDAEGNLIALSGVGADAALRGDLAASTGLALVAFIQDNAAALVRTALAKMREVRVSPADFGAIADADPSDCTGTDNQAALEAAIAFLAPTGGELFLPRGCYYGFGADLVFPGNVRIVGENERNCGLVGLADGDFAEAVVKMGSTGIVFSSGLRNAGIYCRNAAVPCLLWIGAQENCVLDNFILKGSTVEPLQMIGWGIYNNPAGNVLASPAHKAEVRNGHIITAAGDSAPLAPTKGMTLKGVDACLFRNLTITTPPTKSDGATPQDMLGTIGLEAIDGVHLCTFEHIYLEGFASPMKFSGTASGGALLEHIQGSSPILAVPAGSSVIEIASASDCLPFVAREIYPYGNKWDNLIKVSGSVNYTLAKTALATVPLHEFRLFSSKNNPAGVSRVEIIDDTLLQIARKVQFSNLRIGTFRTFADGDTTPSVGDGNEYITANTAPTEITTLDDMVSGQTLRIWVGDNNTTFKNSANFKIKGGANYAAVADDVLTFMKKGAVIKEVGTR